MSIARLWPRLLVAAGSGLLLLVWLDRPRLGIDTVPLMRGTKSLATCIEHLSLLDCRQDTPIGPFPALQYIPDLAAYAVGLSDGRRVRLLALLSTVAIVACVVAAWTALRRAGSAEWRWVFVAVVASGPVIAYGNTTWGEMLAAGLLTLLVAAALLQVHPALVGLAAFGGGLTKETGYPFVVSLGLAALVHARRRTKRSIRAHLVWGAAGVAAAIAVASALNLIRFGRLTNAQYLDPSFRAPAGRVPELAAGLFVAPNGGILLFWPLPSMLVVLLLGIPIGRAVRERSVREAWPALVLIGVLAGLVFGFASWWVPFGWAAWGPRLSLPWVLPVLLFALAAYGPLLRPFAARALASRTTLALVALATVVVAAPHVGYLWRYQTVPEFFSQTTSLCPAFGPGSGHYACLHEQMWSRRPIWIDALPGIGSAGGVLTLAAVAAVVAGSLVLFRRELLPGAREDAGRRGDAGTVEHVGASAGTRIL